MEKMNQSFTEEKKMVKSVRKDLMEKLGVEKKEVSNLISTYARNHNGQVNVKEIKEDVEKIASSMIYGLGTIYKDYDVKHEILECGKDRQEEAIMSLLLEDEERDLALQYLPNRYYENVDTWAMTFYHTAQKKLSEILDGGIEEYRNFVDELPYENINRVANTFDLENEVAKFLAVNGNQSDFQKFMTDVEPIRNSEKAERRSCPRNISKKLFRELQEEVKENDSVSFSRRDIMRGLSSIHNNKTLTQTEKEQLQDSFIKNSLRGEFDEKFVKLNRTGVTFDTLKEYLEIPTASWEEKEKFLTQKVLPISEEKMQKAYDVLLADLDKKSQLDKLTPEQIVERLDESALSQNGKNYISISEDEESKKAKLLISVPHPVIRNESMDIELDGTKLKEIMDCANSNSLDEANKQLELITQKGIGEASVYNGYKLTERFRHSLEKNILGSLGEENDSPYVIGGELSRKAGLIDLKVKCPYTVISDNMQLESEVVDMTPEQVQQFNHKAEPVQVAEHCYSYGRVDGFYNRSVLDFEINGEKYHIKGADWTNGGTYTVIWKGEEKNYPETAIGLSSSYSEWARNQRGVDKSSVIAFISENPKRFSEYYDSHAKNSDSCGLFPTRHIETLCEEIMEMSPESELKGKEIQYPEDEFLQKVVDSATARKTLSEKEKDAQGLLKEYEQLVPVQEKGLDD